MVFGFCLVLLITFQGLAAVVGQTPSYVLGCYADNVNDRDIKGTMQQISSNTLAVCRSVCATQGYAYAGAQASGWCLCGNSFGKYGKVPDSNCDYSCPADRSVKCGGLSKNTVMTTVLGCYADETTRDINGTIQQTTANTLPVCSNLCATQGYAFAGAQGGGWCLCGNWYGRYGQISDSSCALPCSGNSSMRCGGSMANTVMATGLPALATSLQTPAAPSYVLGCYRDGPDRDIKGSIQSYANNTLTSCRDLCAKQGYKYAGAQGGGWCLCGNSYGRYGQIALSNCNWPCGGNSSLRCGGQWANTVMITEADPCSTGPCKNGGVCDKISSTQARCTCVAGWVGTTCETVPKSHSYWSTLACYSGGSCSSIKTPWCEEADPCSAGPCKNGGVCDKISGTQAGCTCVAGWIGTTCETEADPCSDGPCKNGGVCDKISSTQARCTCVAGWIGATCETEADPCSTGPCKNGGVCDKISSTQARCTCVAGWIGATCETEADPCSTGPCKNGGVCDKISSTQARCTCVAGWTGATCETEADPCTENPCQNAGLCSKVSSTVFKCTCTAGWTGTTCSEVDNPCKVDSCHNGGTCNKESSTTFTCSCVPDWTGVDCTTEVDVCKTLPTNYCQNGGTCVKIYTTFECRCAPGWAGDQCQIGNAACRAVSASARFNCGWGNIKMEECSARSCCYDETYKNSAVCYFPDYQTICDNTRMDERNDCGWISISYLQCIGRGCCFNDDEDNTGPICYRKANPMCIGVKTADRIKQGVEGITPNVCIANGWCYDSSIPKTAGPWCFTRAIN